MSSISSFFRFFLSLSLDGRLPSLVGFDKSLEDVVVEVDGLEDDRPVRVGVDVLDWPSRSVGLA